MPLHVGSQHVAYGKAGGQPRAGGQKLLLTQRLLCYESAVH